MFLLKPFACVALLAIFLALGPSLSNANIVDDIRALRPFELKKSDGGCPVPVIGPNFCPESNPLFYFGCCGDLKESCCFRLQDWVWIVILILVVSVVISIIVNLIRCMCCY